MDEKKSTDIVPGDNKAPLVIFNISKMSNFFDSYVHEIMFSICDSSTLQDSTQLPIADLSIIGAVINQADVIIQGNVTLLPDFDNLPSDVRIKLKKEYIQLENLSR